ncbi:hypothetical protein L6164_034594 [Bauhinia variegata]|uniref:Uncharacterized protein n=1 Tax=Bauhinia variegata TaxID=167791 RepID=A0ACB9KWQ8_BAUVA|nr:hypothetical protein L6164_034594 [Bauhinia variegata]
MRGSQLPLSQTQKIQLQKALRRSKGSGHGTADLNDEVVATLCGVVERVNKLVYVRALRARLLKSVGDW